MRSRLASLVLVWMFVSSMLALLPVGGYFVDIPEDVSDAVLDSSASPPGCSSDGSAFGQHTVG